MSWIGELAGAQPAAHAIGVFALVCLAGMALGGVRVRGVCLGSAGVLLSGLVAGHWGKPVNPATLQFVKEFGLALFVFTIGLQLGPGFFAALRQQGLPQNAMAAGVVLLGAGCAPLIGWLAGFDGAAVLGIFSGASVNMPSLGAALQALGDVPGVVPERLALPAAACAVTFPTAIVASIGALLILRWVFRIEVAHELSAWTAKNRPSVPPLERRTLVVANPALEGVRVGALPGREKAGVTLARIRRGAETLVATEETVLRGGDLVAVVGTREGLDRFEGGVGPRSGEDLVLGQSGITFRRVRVTARRVVGESVGQLRLDARFGVAVTRVTRADLELTAVPEVRLQFGDALQLVGRPEDLDRAAAAVGNSLKEINETHFVPIFLGLLLGVLLGTMPVSVPGLPQPVRLGLAGGPLLVALVLGRLGRVGPLVCHLPVSANLAFRDFGIALFFAAVGLESGSTFFATVASPVGLQWMLAGAGVTMVPLLVMGGLARVLGGMNFVDLSGLLTGSTTNPPALTFANGLIGTDAPTVVYATVYPLTMILRILAAQVLALALCGSG